MVDDSPDSSSDDADGEPDAVTLAADELYAGPSEDFMAARTRLAAAAKKQGDAAAAKRIGGLRKPTVAASVVNRWVHHDPDTLDRLADLYDRLSRAHEDLDAATLRELSTERRTEVGELTRSAFGFAGVEDPTTAVRDEVVATFDAAVADPEILSRLGRLTRSEQWSGFGVALPPAGSPALRLVRGGKHPGRSTSTTSTSAGSAGSAGQAGRSTKAEPDDASTTTRARDRSKAPAGTASTSPDTEVGAQRDSAARRRAARAVSKATAAFETADAAHTAAEQAEREGTERIRSLTAELAQLQKELDSTKQELDGMRREVRSARTRRREARSALDRAERQAPRSRGLSRVSGSRRPGVPSGTPAG